MALTPKTTLQSKINTKIKDNGSTDDTKTKGVDLKEIQIDTTDSYWHKQESLVSYSNGGAGTLSLIFDQDKNIGSVGAFASGNILLKDDVTNIRDKTIKVLHKSSTAPTISKESGLVTRPQTPRKEYVPDTFNLLTFVFLGKFGSSNLWLYIITPIEDPA